MTGTPANTTAPPPIAAPPQRVWLAYGDAVRVLGTLAVMFGHVCDMVLFRGYGYVKDRAGQPILPSNTEWWFCNVVDAASRFAVPLFVMLSGALLLDTSGKQTPREFYLRRFNRVGVPLLFWSAFYTLFVALDKSRGLNSALLDLLRGNPYGHMHFVFRITGLYALTPMFRIFLRHASRRMVVVTTILILVLASGGSVANGVFGARDNAFTIFLPFVGYYFLGYLVKDWVVSGKGLSLCVAGFVATSAAVAVGTWWLAGKFAGQPFVPNGGYVSFDQTWLATHDGLVPFPSISMMLYDFLSPVRVVMAICVFLVFRRVFARPWPKNAFFRFVTTQLGPATLGMYLIHPAFRGALGALGINALWPNVWVGVPLTALLLFVPSAAITLILQRIPGVRWIVG